jgi:hypothetical protein
MGLIVMMALACAQPFTYQGLLKQNGTPANGNYQMTFRLYDVASGGTALGTVVLDSVSVVNGLFTVELNFPASVWDGGLRYLEIQVGGTTLSPRVKINPTPYASTIRLFESGTLNPDRMVITHSPAFSNWGLQYQDAGDKFNFLVGGTPVMTVDLANQRVGIGTSSPGYRLHVQTNAGERAIFGVHTATSGVNIGVWGESSSLNGRGVLGFASATSGINIGVWGESRSPNGRGVLGFASATSGTTYGVWGESSSPDGRGVYGLAIATSGTTYGVWGQSNSPDGTGVYGVHAATIGNTPGVHGRTASTSANAVGVLGEVASTSAGETSAAVRGINLSRNNWGIGVWGSHDGGGWGVYGTSVSGRGVYGLASAGSDTTYGVYGLSYSPNGAGVYGWAATGSGTNYGVYGRSEGSSGTGVFGIALGNNGINYGVYGRNSNPSGYGVYSYGRFAATGTKDFQIDHPLHPETHFLNHFCTEAPEPLNAYSGVVVLDARGEAWVQLPDYFDRINRDPRYILTPVGAPMPNLHVAVEIQNNRFKIAGGVPGKKVSWRVEAIRNDRWVQEYGYQTEQEKPKEYQGKYLHPELFGQPKERGIFYHHELERPREGEKPQ